MGTIAKLSLGLLFNTKESVDGINNYRPLGIGIIIGIFGVILFPYSSLLTRILMGTSTKTDVLNTVIQTPPKGLFYFIVANLAVYFFGRLFGGKDSLLHFVSALGWTGIFNIVISIFFLPVVTVSVYTNYWKNHTSILLLAIILVCLMVVIYSFFKSLHVSVLIVSKALSLRVWKSVVTIIVSFIPLFILYDYIF